ncbi:MAG: hypothetical protein UX18_C0010G0001, partial [Candidatus Azambacteria bacterium GW2011_GWC2_45_7b]
RFGFYGKNLLKGLDKILIISYNVVTRVR